MTKEQVISLLEKERAWMLGKVEDYKKNPGIGGWDSGWVSGAKEAYDECQNSLIHVIEEIKKL